MEGEELSVKVSGIAMQKDADAPGYRRPDIHAQVLPDPLALRNARNAEAIREAEKRAEQSRIKNGVAALFGLRSV